MAPTASIISAFRGIRYRTAGSRDLSSRIAPPYDIITETTQGDLYRRDAHNFVRVELPQKSADDQEDNRYTRAAATLRDWLAQGVLIRDEQPALYLLEQEFQLQGRSWRRRAVFALLRLPEAGERYVLSHEGTLAAARADRLRLMRACRAMTSPVLVMSEDPGSGLMALLAEVPGEPEAIAEDSDGVVHRLWIVSDTPYLEGICAAVGAGPLFIADGHHRFETALTYRDEMRQAARQASPQAGFNYALALVTSAQDEAVRILPAHRVISGLGEAGLERMQAGMRDCCEMHSLPPPAGGQLTVQTWLEGVGADRPAFGACWGDGHCYLLTTRNETRPASPSPVASLDVSILHRRLIDPVISRLGDGAKISYVTDEQQAVAAVSRGEYDLAVFVRPTRVSDVLKVARAGERMPGKSTYFYPKATAGLVLSDASPEPI